MNGILKKQTIGIHRLLGACVMTLFMTCAPAWLWAQIVAVSGAVVDDNN